MAMKAALLVAPAAAFGGGIALPDEATLKASLENTKRLEAEFLAKNAVSSVNVTVSVPHCTQACQSWCWATCATMIAGRSDCTSAEQSAVQHEIDPSCDTSCPSGVCNQGGTGPQIADAISYLGGSGDYGYTNSALSQDDLDSALQAGPIAALYDCGSYGGHGVIYEGGSGGSYSGYDPEGYSISAQYDGVTTYRPSYIGATCQWFGTTYAGAFSAAQVELENPTCSGPGESCCPAPQDDPNNCPDSARTSNCDAQGACCCGFLTTISKTPASAFLTAQVENPTCSGPGESCCPAPQDDPNNCPDSARTSNCDAQGACCCGFLTV